MASALSPSLQCHPHGTHFVLHPSTDHQPTVGKRARTNASDAMQESVYHLLPEEIRQLARPARYHSKHAAMVAAEYKHGQRAAATIGPLKVQQAVTSDYLKRGESEQRRAQQASTSHATRENDIKPSGAHETLPKAVAAKDFLKRSHHNYVKDNMEAIIGAHPPASNTSEMVYREKADYGRAPDYLADRKQELQERQTQELAKEQALERQRAEASGLTLLAEEDRLQVLAGLKANWEVINREYGKLSLVVDTLPKITRKLHLEKQLQQLESDIETFSHANVYVQSS